MVIAVFQLVSKSVGQLSVKTHFHAVASWGTPASLRFLRKGIISRSSRPTVSMGWVRAASRVATTGHGQSVTHVPGIKRNLCVQNGPAFYWRARGDSNL